MPLPRCQQLKKLNLFSTSIDSKGLAVVARLPLLEDLDLSECKAIDCFDALSQRLQLKRDVLARRDVKVFQQPKT